MTALFRLILAIPIIVVISLVSGYSASGDPDTDRALAPLFAGGVLWLAVVLMLLFRRKYPRWWFDWNLELQRFGARVGAYLLLLRDEYPSTDEEQSVHLDIPYPAAEEQLNRFLPLIKWLLAIPHYIVLIILGVVAFIVTVHCLASDTDNRKLSPRHVCLCRRSIALELQSRGLCLSSDHDRYPPFRLGE